ncbi:MAG: hypothetical protein GFH27_549309n140 [Chloroflexi bacterium AL-W]|nr:hypothetical protein [Chloroflexi bacterium AL-N1]NOK69842.1 hypothetical protein [Chloroflexi bacterium AL-N10]NOK73554.1 hypothetical protein [Chloroflexi bacterium AL-N5]NOK84012.1 hypothetical protein [Chloroflexi bacterium AL-W]NOK87885.1 hypothetical protein [Chloroflexi bacterium AL-N15]
MITSLLSFLDDQKKFLLAAITALFPVLFVFVTVWLIQTTGYTGVEVGVSNTVLEVYPDSPGAGAGFLVGDQIIISDDNWSSVTWDQIRVGEFVVVAIQRDSETITLELQATVLPLRQWWTVLWPLFSALVFWATAARLLMGVRQINDDMLRFSLFAYLSAYTLLLGRFQIIHPLQDVVFNLVSVSASISYVYFHSQFPYKIHQPLLWNLTLIHRWIGIVSLICILGMAFLTFLMQLAVLNDIAVLIGAIYLILTNVLIGVLLVYGYMKSTTQRVRSRIRLIASAFIIVFVMRFLFVFTIFAPVNTFDGLTQIWLSRISFLVQALIPIAYLVTLRREDFYQVDRSLNRAFLYTLVIFSLVGLHWLTIFGLMLLVSQQVNDSLLLHSVIGAILAVLFVPLRDYVAVFINRLFYGREANMVLTGQRLARDLARSIDEKTLTEVLTRRVSQLFDPTNAALFLRSKEDGWYCSIAMSYTLKPNTIEAVGALAGRLNDRPVMQASEVQRLAPSVALSPKILPSEGVFLCFTIGTQPRGILWMGSKTSQDNYTEQDMEILRLLVLPGALALENIELTSALANRTAELQYLYDELVQADDRVRQHLAREIHDHIMQDIYGELYKLQVRQELAEQPDPQLNHLRDTLERLLTDLRQLCNGLHPPVLDELGLSSALRATLQENATVVAPRVQITEAIDDLDERLPPEVENGLFAIAKSALMNAVRHSQATRIDVALTTQDNTIVLEVQDNGVGFQVPKNSTVLLKEKRFGLASMRERAQIIGATCSIHSEPGEGTHLLIKWSLSTELNPHDNRAIAPLLSSK